MTAAFVANGNVFDPRLGFDRGFDVFRATSTEDGDRTARGAVSRAVGYIEKQSSPRFFLFVHVIDPHQPIFLEPDYQTIFSAESGQSSVREQSLLDYDRSIRQADDQFQRIVDALKRKNWWVSATVIYTADHGEEFFEHGRQGHGKTIFEEQVRIPLIVKYPGNREAGTRRPDPVTIADITPTIAEMTGVRRLAHWIGASFRRPISSLRSIYFTEELDDARVYGLRRGGEKLVVQLYPSFQRSVYDLGTDAAEQRGTAIPCGKDPGRYRELLRDFDKWHATDVAEYPGLTLEKTKRLPLVVDVRVNLAELPKPFVTVEDLCRLSPLIEGTRLQAVERVGGGYSYRLQVTTNARGDAPAINVAVSSAEGTPVIDLRGPDSPVRVHRVDARFIRGDMTDDIWRHLKSLGYLAGDENPKTPL